MMTFDDDFSAIKFLENAGYNILNNGLIRAPTKDHVETKDEREALDFLFVEWDYADEPREMWKPYNNGE